MAWLRIDDRVRTHPKIAKAGPAAAWLWFCGICYCREHLTDGLIPSAVVPGLALGLTSAAVHAKRLVAVGLWHERQDGFEVHDFLDWNPKRSDVESERNRERDRKRKERGHQADGELCPTGQDQDPSRVGAGAPARALGSLEGGAGETVSQADAGAGEAFWQAWRRLFAETQSGAVVPDLEPRARDVEHVVFLVTAYPEMWRLTAMAELYLRLDVPDLRNKPRSIGMFRHWAPWCDAEIRKAGLAGAVA